MKLDTHMVYGLFHGSSEDLQDKSPAWRCERRGPIGRAPRRILERQAFLPLMMPPPGQRLVGGLGRPRMKPRREPICRKSGLLDRHPNHGLAPVPLAPSPCQSRLYLIRSSRTSSMTCIGERPIPTESEREQLQTLYGTSWRAANRFLAGPTLSKHRSSLVARQLAQESERRV